MWWERPIHDTEDRIDEFVETDSWNRSLMEFTKTKRGFRHARGSFRTDSWTATLKPFCIFQGHGLEPSGHSLGVAMLAPRTDLATTRYWVPGDVSPFYALLGRHPYKCSRMCLAILVAGPIPFEFPTQNINSNSAVFVEFLRVRDVFRNLRPNRVSKFFL